MHQVRPISRRVARGVLTAVSAVALAASTVALSPSAAAAPTTPTQAAKAGEDLPKPPPAPKRKVHQKPAPRPSGGVSTRSAASGGSSGNFNNDAWPDILARSSVTNELKVYPHSGTYTGAPSTYPTAVTINNGWGGVRWIGRGRMAGAGGQPRALSDVIAIENTPQTAGNMYVHVHSGVLNGTSTLSSKVLISTGWQPGDLIFVYDWNNDGWDDILRRPAVGNPNGNTYVYLHSKVFNGTQTLLPAQLVIEGGTYDIEQNMADMTGDGMPDLVYLQWGTTQNDQWLSVYDFQTGQAYSLGTGWQSTNALLISDVNKDGNPDVVARVPGSTPPAQLVPYLHSGKFIADPMGRAFGVLLAPNGANFGYGWSGNDVIT
ncbi:hypothetical protein ALI144C_05980 [Actinosynnema sp. ALI-1.44]|uniref:FG-GAP repeat domain-containing protein n=1 Tax=Actinosynnema sp. ALI-1.44 TaxID=1933779 RepID=UPI0009D2B63E|nr:VCBS repeat-containing protein [Actinosynnema sp. ALI-1.44]ONI88587.1 hypothetical protein ALI144C_05980 [Actinosynnema sp. ALI-1.44]